jgi:hypothetical protein
LRAPFCCNYRTQDRGCGAHPVFPAPSDFEGKVLLQNFGQIMPRECEVAFREEWPATNLEYGQVQQKRRTFRPAADDGSTFT